MSVWSSVYVTETSRLLRIVLKLGHIVMCSCIRVGLIGMNGCDVFLYSCRCDWYEWV